MSIRRLNKISHLALKYSLNKDFSAQANIDPGNMTAVLRLSVKAPVTTFQCLF